MRDRITFKCSECGEENYIGTRNKRKNPERMQIQKYCPRCNKKTLQVNTYLLWEENHVLIVDPGSKSHKLQETIDSQNGVVDAIVLTHGHFDHIAGVDALVKKYHCPVYINELDMAMLQDPMLNFSYQAPVVVNSPVTKLKPGKNSIGAFTLQAIVIFQGSIGRTDLPTGSNTKMMQTLRMIRETLPSNLKVYPGHGPDTTLDMEFRYNPYLRF